jgi:hypothetical protein
MKEINMRNEQSNDFDLPDIIGFNQKNGDNKQCVDMI